MKLIRFFVFCILISSAEASLVPVNRMDQLKNEIGEIENQILESTDHKQTINSIQRMSKLVLEQQKLGLVRQHELGRLLDDLQLKDREIREAITDRKHRIHFLMVSYHRLKSKTLTQILPSEQEKLESPKRESLARLIREVIRENEELQIDLEDAGRIAEQIEVERADLAQFQVELQQQKQILALSHEVQNELLKRKQSERLTEFKAAQKQHRARGEIDRLMSGLSARMELQRALETERKVTHELANSEFAKLRGKFLLPIKGSIVGTYGKSYDPISKMVVFKKGIDILPASDSKVKAIYAGTIAFTGVIPHYGLVALINHGNHFYSLLGRLQSVKKKKGDPVLLGEVIGESELKGDSVYFEIRAGNVALNPMQWLAQN